jgi:hypothetical protein
MLNDLSVFTEPWRKKQPFGYLGDPARKLAADPTAYTLYFTGDGSWGKESFAGREGFWVRAEAEAELILRVLDLAPIRRVKLEATAGPGRTELRCRLDGETQVARLEAGGAAPLDFSPSRGFPYYETFLHVLRCGSAGGAAATDGRRLGAFITLTLVTD